MKSLQCILFATLLGMGLLVMLLPENGFALQTDNQGRPLYHSDRVTVKLKPRVPDFRKSEGAVTFGIPSLDLYLSRLPIESVDKRFRHRPIPANSGLPDLSRIYEIILNRDIVVDAVVHALNSDPNVEYAEPTPICYPDRFPNDTLYAEQPFLQQIWAEEAWDVHRGVEGSEPVIIGITDTGVEWYHPDLLENIWQNLGEDADGDGQVLVEVEGQWQFDPDDINDLDDDGNGYADDFIGWDFLVDDDFRGGPNPDDVHGHGTHVAGLAAGVTNNVTGIASISWNVKIMSTSHSAPGYGGIYYGYDGIIYLAENGADIINCSWGSFYRSEANAEAVRYATGLGSVVVASAGNDDTDMPHYPSSYPGVVSVAALGNTDAKATYSCYGMGVDISAPGGDLQKGGQLLSTWLNGGYERVQGTSMSGPVVAGVLGLLKSYHPEWTADQLITQLLATADNIDIQNPGYDGELGTGRVNTYRALTETNPTMPQALRLELIEVFPPTDNDGNGSLEPGETASLNVQLQNWTYGIGAEDVTFTLTCDDPDVQILEDQVQIDIPADDYFPLEDVFSIRIADEATMHEVQFQLDVEADIQAYIGREMSFTMIVAPGGILVYDVDEQHPNSSGGFIREFLHNHGQEFLFTSEFPTTLSGFQTVFLCMGNWEMENSDYLDPMKSATVISFLKSGGNLFLEGGDALGTDSVAVRDLLPLIGLESAEDGETNKISLLEGEDAALTAGMRFTQDNLIIRWSIDRYYPDTNGIPAFVEDGYGTVAVQNEGEYDQKTFCFSYPVSRLADEGLPSTRYNFMRELMLFFGYNLPLVTDFQVSTSTGHAPLTVDFTACSITEDPNEEKLIRWDLDGDQQFDVTGLDPQWTYTDTGTYNVTMEVTTLQATNTLKRDGVIRVMGGESALDFPGYNGWIFGYISRNHAINLTTSFTMEAWVRPDGWGSYGKPGFGNIFYKGQITVFLNGTSHSSYNDHSLVVYIRHENGELTIANTGAGSIALNTWQHVAVTYDASGDEPHVYIGGKEEVLSFTEKSSGPVADNLYNSVIIGNNFSLRRGFAGKIDEIRLWNIARTREEIADNKAGILSGGESGLVGYFPLNEGQGHVSSDLTGTMDLEIINPSWTSGLPLDIVGYIPRALVGSIENYGARLQWQPPLVSEDIQEYRIYQRLNDDTKYTFVNSTTDLHYLHPVLQFNTRYRFRVSAVYAGGVGEGPQSNEAEVMLTSDYFPGVTNLLTVPENQAVVLMWDPPFRPNSTELKYDNGEAHSHYGVQNPEGDELFAVGFDVPAGQTVQAARLCLSEWSGRNANFRVYLAGDSLGKPNINDVWFAGTAAVRGDQAGARWVKFDFPDWHLDESTRLYVMLKMENYQYYPVSTDTLAHAGNCYFSGNMGEGWGEYPSLNFMFRLQIAPDPVQGLSAHGDNSVAGYPRERFRRVVLPAISGIRDEQMKGVSAGKWSSDVLPRQADDAIRENGDHLTIDGYRIYRSTEREGDYIPLGSSSELATRNMDLVNGRKYYFKVDVVYSEPDGESPSCRPVLAVPNSEQTPVPVNPVAGRHYADFIPLTWYNNANTAEEYMVYRSTDPESDGELLVTVRDSDRPYTPFSDFLDETADAGTDYYYRIKGIYNGARSEFSMSVAGRRTGLETDSLLTLPWARYAPELDGIIKPDEWAWQHALALDLRMEGMLSPVTVFLINDGDYLYVAVNDSNNTDGGDRNIFNIYFDTDGNGTWPNASGKAEGNFHFCYEGYEFTSMFRRIIGFYPDKLQFGSFQENDGGVEATASVNTGHLQFEIRIDLSREPLEGGPGSLHRFWFFTTNDSYHEETLFPWQGAWPRESIWLHPGTYAQYRLASGDITAVDRDSGLPERFALYQNYPNPFNPTTTIRYALPRDCRVSLIIYNMLGQQVRSLVQSDQAAGWHDIIWDGTTDYGQQVGSGVYLCRIEAGSFTEAVKMVILR